jgi:hypothetical protein
MTSASCVARDAFSTARGSWAGMGIPASRARISTASMKDTFSVSFTKEMASPFAWQPKQ